MAMTTPKDMEQELREKVIHALGLCRYKCNGNPHIPAMDTEESADIDAVMQLFNTLTYWYNKHMANKHPKEIMKEIE